MISGERIGNHAAKTKTGGKHRDISIHRLLETFSEYRRIKSVICFLPGGAYRLRRDKKIAGSLAAKDSWRKP